MTFGQRPIGAGSGTRSGSTTICTRPGSREPADHGRLVLGGLAAVTNRIRFGTMVTANTFRHPALLAKQAVTLDQHVSEAGSSSEVRLARTRARALRHRSAPAPRAFRDARRDLPHTARAHDRGGLRLHRETSINHLGTFRTEAGAEAQTALRDRWLRPAPDDPAGLPAGPTSGTIRTSPPSRIYSSPPCDVSRRRAIGRDRSEIEVSVQFRYPGDPDETADLVAAYRSWGRSCAGQLHATDEHRSPPGSPRGWEVDD